MFILALIPLSVNFKNSQDSILGGGRIVRVAKIAYEFSRSKEKINHLLFMDDLS